MPKICHTVFSTCILLTSFFCPSTVFSDALIVQEPGGLPRLEQPSIESFFLDGSVDKVAGIKINRSALAELYHRHRFESLWITGAELNSSSYIWVNTLEASWKHGLNPEDYHLSSIQSMLDIQSDHLLDLEILLSDGLLRFSRDMKSGNKEFHDAAPDWNIPVEPFDLVREDRDLFSNTGMDRFIQSLIPSNDDYHQLQRMLVEYIALKASGGWQSLGQGPALEKNIRHVQVVTLRNQLRLINDYTADMQADPYYFSTALENAVKKFQYRHHLVIDGVVGAATRQALNIPIDYRIDQIKLALERLRWLPDALGEKYIWVNLASSTLEVIEKGEQRLSMRSIIGRSYRPTPSLASELSTIVFNPEWVVPRRIAVEDMLPVQQKLGDYLQKKNIRVLAGWSGVQSEINPDDIDWNALNENYFPYQLRQSPGPHNSLGRFKFLFKNPFEIYLHDTPAKRLFSLEKRTFSSGCVRIEKPEALASILLQNNPDVPDSVWHSKKTRYIRLAKKIPVYIVYMTAWVEKGEIHFQRDFYGRDRSILKLMNRNS
ncbi:MAG: L,D-transpeptidase family protein [Gammaproteobacteria bacterium]